MISFKQFTAEYPHVFKILAFLAIFGTAFLWWKEIIRDGY